MSISVVGVIDNALVSLFIGTNEVEFGFKVLRATEAGPEPDNAAPVPLASPRQTPKRVVPFSLISMVRIIFRGGKGRV